MNSIQETKPGTVSILIGPNGSGKSRKLRKLCDGALRKGMKVIAIAPTIYDRFINVRSDNFRFFGGRQGRSASKNVVRDALIRAAVDKPQILKNLVQVLNYTNFDPSVGVSIEWVDMNRFYEVGEELGLEGEERGDLDFALRAWGDKPPKEKGWEVVFSGNDGGQWNGEAILKFSMDRFSFQELHRLAYGTTLRYESLLVRLKVIARPKYYFFRGGKPLPLLEACSGELCFITSMAFISTEIEENSCIMIDEPENSLHPTWQKLCPDNS